MSSKSPRKKVQQFNRYWRSKCANELLPSRASIDPVEIPRLLPYLVIAKILPEPRTRVVEANGSDYTDCYLDECDFLVEPLLAEC